MWCDKVGIFPVPNFNGFLKSMQKSELTEVNQARLLKGDDALLCITGVKVRKKQDKVCVPACFCDQQKAGPQVNI